MIDTTQPQHDRLLGALRIIGIVAAVGILLVTAAGIVVLWAYRIVTVDVSVDPSHLPGADAMTDARAETAVALAHASTPVLAWATAGIALGGIGTALVLWGIATLAARLRRGEAFAASGQRALAWIGAGIGADGVLAPLASSLASMVAASELGHHYGGGGTIELAPFFWMLVIGALAVLLRTTDRARHDAEGLV